MSWLLPIILGSSDFSFSVILMVVDMAFCSLDFLRFHILYFLIPLCGASAPLSSFGDIFVWVLGIYCSIEIGFVFVWFYSGWLATGLEFIALRAAVCACLMAASLYH